MSSVSKKMWIDGKTYNILKSFDSQQVEEYCTQLIDNVYKRTFRIPSYYHQALQEAQYRNDVKEMEQADTKITISPNSVEESTVTISADEENKVGQSIFYLMRFLSSIRDNVSPRQFLAVPVLNEEVQRNFLKFKEDVLNLGVRGVDERIFQKDVKLHLSINVFSLFDELELDAAKKALADCKTYTILPFIHKMLPLKLDICGIDCMQGNHSKVHVLYAKAKIANENEDFTLQMLLDKINEYFYQRGFTKDSKAENVRIHMTLINTKYRVSRAESKKRWAKRIPIDASKILFQYKDFYFGQSELNRINLCLMSSTEGRFYESIGEIEW